ncbi:hypothetical protein [Mesorhizobium argentiipisi]|uniref:J domain-containing protein n=1 Tax=Mesorhizobium argentiipisi TaxID=3015175 RepID=A0ABU8K9C6_9HYPH
MSIRAYRDLSFALSLSGIDDIASQDAFLQELNDAYDIKSNPALAKPDDEELNALATLLRALFAKYGVSDTQEQDFAISIIGAVVFRNIHDDAGKFTPFNPVIVGAVIAVGATVAIYLVWKYLVRYQPP